MVIKAQNRMLYFAVLAGILFLFLAALGPGIFSSGEIRVNSWQYRVFDVLCHQDPERSFTFSGVQMAVCSRCLGIYGFLAISWTGLPLYAYFKNSSNNRELVWLIIAILLNLTDLIGNYFEIWTNTHTSRLILGSLFGFSIPLILANEFFNLKK
ncbi:DUF2085 domain-containing protein [Gracilimonas sp.]|uniref:DUF2085 domain-containing protein n=1 Tax=Gracilimonas sp. TaxID=1974203 RepID=UPI0028717775|nr:DUF2085 domain-containing protein [Gracilimonas sp.]